MDTDSSSDKYKALYDLAKEDERFNIETVYTGTAGPIIASTSGFISTISSFVIIAVVLNSPQGLSRIYHRLMFSISISDILTSVAIMMSTLPMPKDMGYEQFQGIVMGNQTTCTAQGFFFTLGSYACSMYLGCLIIYYYCSIRLTWNDERFKRIIEKPMHFLTITTSLTTATMLLFYDFYNPTPLDTWCTPISYPWWCSEERRGEDCLLRGDERVYKAGWILAGIPVIFTFLTFMMMALTIRAAKQQTDLFAQWDVEDSNRLKSQVANDIQNDKVVVGLAIAFTCTNFLVGMFPMISLIAGTRFRMNATGLQYFHCAVRPLQGFFNLAIFLMHKVYNLKCGDSSITTTREALVSIFTRPSVSPEPIIHNLRLIKDADGGKINIANGIDVIVDTRVHHRTDLTEPGVEHVSEASVGNVSHFKDGQTVRSKVRFRREESWIDDRRATRYDHQTVSSLGTPHGLNGRSVNDLSNNIAELDSTNDDGLSYEESAGGSKVMSMNDDGISYENSVEVSKAMHSSSHGKIVHNSDAYDTNQTSQSGSGEGNEGK